MSVDERRTVLSGSFDDLDLGEVLELLAGSPAAATGVLEVGGAVATAVYLARGAVVAAATIGDDDLLAADHVDLWGRSVAAVARMVADGGTEFAFHRDDHLLVGLPGMDAVELLAAARAAAEARPRREVPPIRAFFRAADLDAVEAVAAPPAVATWGRALFDELDDLRRSSAEADTARSGRLGRRARARAASEPARVGAPEVSHVA